jgi:hypothetical protein
MTHISETRVIGNHAAMGRSTPAASDAPLTVTDILRAGVRRRAKRKEMAAAQSTWDSEGGAGEWRTTDGEVRSTSLVPRVR